MHPPFPQSLAEKVVEDIREGRGVDDYVARQLNSFPAVDTLRALVREQDVPRITALIESGTEDVVVLDSRF